MPTASKKNVEDDSVENAGSRPSWVTQAATALRPLAKRASKEQRRLRISPVAMAGELLVTAGALLGLLVIWELFWTDVGASREQDALVTALDEAWEDGSLPARVPEFESDLDAFPILPTEFVERTYAPPVLDEPSDRGETFALMYVPRWGEDYVKPISEGTSRRDVLDSLGIGRYRNSEMPGDIGNFAVAAHRTTYGKPFTDIDQLRVGDPIIIRTENIWYVYLVTEYEIVQPNHVSSVASNPFNPGAEPTERYITLTSCHPRYSAAQRYIVHGVLEYWAPVDAGYPPELAGPLATREVA